MVDMATHFTPAACFRRSQSAVEIWAAIQSIFPPLHLGPADNLTVDQGASDISREMRSNLEVDGVTLHEAAIEHPGAIGTVERYHAPLRSSFLKLLSELERKTTETRFLQLAVFFINSTIGPESLCPMLLVFGIIPRPARKTPCLTELGRP